MDKQASSRFLSFEIVEKYLFARIHLLALWITVTCLQYRTTVLTMVGRESVGFSGAG